MSIARACPEEPVSGETASTAVADVLDNTWKFPIPLLWKNQPAFDRLPAEAIECDVKCLLRDKTVIYFFESRVEWKCPCFVESRFPERIEVRGFLALGAVDFEFIERKVKECHAVSVCRQVNKYTRKHFAQTVCTCLLVYLFTSL